jgi:hypothetical protein
LTNISGTWTFATLDDIGYYGRKRLLWPELGRL